MKELSELLSSVASLLWPLLVMYLVVHFREPLSALLKSVNGGKLVFKVGNIELSSNQYQEQTTKAINDMQSKIAAIESSLKPIGAAGCEVDSCRPKAGKAVLWVDDIPQNNSYYVESLISDGVVVDLAVSTAEAQEKMTCRLYDVVITDIGRPEGEKAGIDLVKQIRLGNVDIPVYVFCGGWAARNLKAEALRAGANGITSSGTTLLAYVSRALLRESPQAG
jgi:CheY-like chemotaxis protein